MAHPLLTDVLMFQARVALRRKGCTRAQINSVMDGVSESTIENLASTMNISLASPFDDAAGDTPPVVPPSPIPSPTPPKSHPILDWIKAFIASPQGQALLAALVQMLLHSLGM